jgi:hypothetical protein
LIAAKRSSRIAEAACDIVLICVSRFEKQNHGVSFGGAIFDGIVGKDDTMDKDHSLFSLSLKAKKTGPDDGAGRTKSSF